ncbi:MAG: DUF1684 domain-containing protein [Anaerolineales bacterium]
MPSINLELADYRRRVAEIYARARDTRISPETRWKEFRIDQDDLFKTHPQTALTPDQITNFTSLRYYPYNPAMRFVVPVEKTVDQEVIRVELRDDGLTRMQPFGIVSFEVNEQVVSLTLFWITGYGGGIFLPFRDLTNGSETFPGGRYLLDTIKGADLGREGNRLVIDFNFAYNPSCAYNDRWSCPLPPPENNIPVPIKAGEMRFE